MGTFNYMVSKDELIALANKADYVEVYEYINGANHVHTDTISYIGNGNFDVSELDCLSYNSDNMTDADVYIMDKEDYESTILANCGETWRSMGFKEEDRVLVIVEG
jgi:hypothetical protein